MIFRFIASMVAMVSALHLAKQAKIIIKELEINEDSVKISYLHIGKDPIIFKKDELSILVSDEIILFRLKTDNKLIAKIPKYKYRLLDNISWDVFETEIQNEFGVIKS